MNQSPKKILKNFRNRNKAFGTERRLNMYKAVLENEPHFPKTLTYEDFDRTLFDWVEDSFDLTYDGKKFNTYKLFSNQRISEYGQTWQNVDDKGNLDINFKTLTREPNPQQGEITGKFYNIPGNITFPIFRVKALDENGVEYIESYSMKQPVAVNLVYTVGIFTNTYKMVNEMNKGMMKEFKSLERYIFPNGYAIPMELTSVSDTSVYTIDDRKYYSQSFQVKVMGYIITEDDYIVTKTPSRGRVQFVSGVNSTRRKNRERFDIQPMIAGTPTYSKKKDENCQTSVAIDSLPVGLSMDEIMNKPSRDAEIEIEELCGAQPCWENTEDKFYVNRKVVINMNWDCCNSFAEFICDYHLGIEGIQLRNIQGYTITINGIEVNTDDSDIEIMKGDSIGIAIEKANETLPSQMTLICYDIDSIISKDNEEAVEIIDKW